MEHSPGVSGGARQSPLPDRARTCYDSVTAQTQAQVIFHSSLASPLGTSSSTQDPKPLPLGLPPRCTQAQTAALAPLLDPGPLDSAASATFSEPSTPVPRTQVAKFNGRWEGMSVPWNKAKNQTWWTDCHLMFTPHPADPHRYKIKGNGTSVWRKETILFQVVGTFDASTCRFELFKTHTGKYTNTVRFSGKLHPRALTLRGEYRDGSLSLVRVDAPTDESPGAPSTLPRALSSPMDGSSSRSSNTPEISPEVPGALEITRMGRQTSPHNATLTEAEAVARILTGTWEGESTRTATGVPTCWADCALQFTIEHGQRSGMLSGQGQSLWKGERIPFLVEGSFDPRSLRVDMTKSHVAKWTNSVRYSCTIDLGNCSLQGTYQQGTLLLRKVRGAHGRTSSIGRPFGAPPSPQRSPVPSPRRPVSHGEVDDYLSPASVLSDRKLATGSWMDDDRLYQNYLASGVERQSNTKHALAGQSSPIPDAVPSHRFSFASPSHDRPGARPEPQDADTSSALETYRVFLSALLSAGSINSTQHSAYQRYRTSNKISDDMHAAALAQLGVTQAQFGNMHVDDPDSDTCKICYDRKINTVLLPCGHFTCCSTCARSLDKCPVCRQRIAEAKVVYRA